MRNPNKQLWVFLLLVICTIPLWAQSNRRVNGLVRDAAGEPIIGATVLVKETKQGTVTDLDGRFTLSSVPSKGVLVVSYMGYITQMVSLSDSDKPMTITLKEDAKNLDEIVVIGYGTQKKSSLTSSVETIKKEDLLAMPTANLDQALVGQVSGMHVKVATGDPSSAKEADIRIRGIQGEPLLVIDGVPRFGVNTSEGEMRLSDMNPDDIESVSILKDAAAAAVYGARAANGVILVKTKRGTSNQKVGVNYRGQFNLTQATRLPDFVNAYDYAQLYNQALANSPGVTGKKPFTEEQMQQIRDHSNPNMLADENMLDYLNKFGYSTTHSLTVAGGNSLVRYYVSGGYTNTKGLYGGVGRDRYNYAIKLDATLLKGLTMQVDVTGTRSENKNTSYSTLDAAYSFSPTQPLRFTNGMLASIEGSNPLISVDGLGGYVRNQMNFNTITANLNYELAAVKGLSFYGRFTMDDNNQVVKNFSTPVTLYTYKTAQQNGETIPVYEEDSRTVYPKAKISLKEEDYFMKNILLEAGVNYNRTFGGVHDVTGLMVANYQDVKNRSLSGLNENMPGVYPEIFGSQVSGKVSGYERYSERASLIGRLTYGYRNTYFVESSFRMDGSTKFHPDYRWDFFPTGSFSWLVSNEPFFHEWNQRVLSNVKVRGSVGLLGDDAGIGEYSYLLNYIFNLRNHGYQFGDAYRPGIVIDSNNSFPNPQLEMGKSQDYNVALDLGLWDNRFGITFEHYWRYRYNMIKTAPVYLFPSSVGLDGNLPNINFGRVKAWGWDLTLNHKNAIGKFKYDLTFIASKTDDVVLDYGDESSLPPSQRRKGRRSTLALMYQADGLFQSQEEIDALEFDQDGAGNMTLAPGDIKYVDRNDDGKISNEDRYMVRSSSQPDLTLGLNMGLHYRSFFVSARFQGVLGYVQQVNDLYTLESGSLQRFQRYHMTDTWTKDNPTAQYPRLKFASTSDNNRKVSTYWIKECDFMRLKSLSIGYSLPSSLTKKMRISSLSVALQGSNLFTLSTLENMDPESLRGYPVQRTYGVSLNFGL